MNTPILPDFTRWAWSSVASRAWFAPMVQSASNAFMDIERWSVVEGLRHAAFQYVSYANVPAMSQWAIDHDVLMVPMSNGSTGGYSATSSGKAPNSLRVLFTTPEYYPKLNDIFKDNAKIGELLGYPTCCRKAFDDTWGQGQVDSTYEQFRDAKRLDIFRKVWKTPYSHTLLRWMGIRAVPHMPCHHYCEASQDQAQGFMGLGAKRGYLEDMMFLHEALNWPVQWSRLFGIGEVVTPVLKISMRSDWTPERQSYEKKGSIIVPEEHWWTDNGYQNPDSMRTAHLNLIHSLTYEIPQNARVLDLGCGNAMLLRKLKVYRPDITICGIDINNDAIGRIPPLTGKFIHTSIENTDVWTALKPDAVLFNPCRLTELTETGKVVAAINTIPNAYFYQYSDWTQPLQSYADIGGWTVQPLTKTPLVEVGVRVTSK